MRSAATTQRGLALVLISALWAGCAPTRPANLTATASPNIDVTAPPVPAATAVAPIATSNAPTVTASPSHGPVPAGRLAFGTFDQTLGGFVVFTARPDGADLKQLLPGEHEIPRWSPDATLLAVTSSSATANVFGTILKADGTGARDLALQDPTLHLGCAAWSPDAKHLACEGWDDTTPGREGIYVVSSADGSGLRRLTRTQAGIHDIPGGFSPDGARIVFVHATDGDHELGELWVMDVTGKNAHRLSSESVGFGTSFSPDGSRILGDRGGDLFVYALSDPKAGLQSIHFPDGRAFGARWSPDGRRLVFSYVASATGGQPELYTARADGTDLWRVTATQQRDEFGDWGLPR